MLHVLKDPVDCVRDAPSYSKLFELQRQHGVQLMLHYNGNTAVVSYATEFSVGNVDVAVRQGGLQVGGQIDGFDLRYGEAWYHNAVLRIANLFGSCQQEKYLFATLGEDQAITGIVCLDRVTGPVSEKQALALRNWLSALQHRSCADHAPLTAFVALCDKLLKVYKEEA